MSIYGNPMMMGGSGGGTIVPKTITANGTYNASADNADGYDPVVVNVSGSSPYTVLEPLHTDFNGGYLGSSTQWYYEPNDTYRSDIYQVEAGKHYIVHLGGTVGNRFRMAYFTEDPYTAARNLTGYQYFYADSPSPYMVAVAASSPTYTMLTPVVDGFLLIQKTNQGVTGIKSYVSEFVEP